MIIHDLSQFCDFSVLTFNHRAISVILIHRDFLCSSLYAKSQQHRPLEGILPGPAKVPGKGKEEKVINYDWK